MSYDAARIWLTTRSLLMISGFGLAYIIAPATRFPLSFEQALSVLQIVFPLFLGYLASAVVFVTKQDKKASEVMSGFLRVLITWPFYVVALLSFAIFFAFGVSNWPSETANTGHGMSFDTMSSLISLVLGIHTATTSALIAYLFKLEKDDVG
jgi:ABC-type dipeptide/oligopeptide/nickel transport system permease component